MALRGLFIAILCLFVGLFLGAIGTDKPNKYDDESLDLLYKNAYYKGALNYQRGWDETQFKIDSLEFKIKYINLR